ncbi:MAG: DNA cytosine methyltransferase [Syntrophales bacterium]|nr:DNA cytosine methyltransferase [Syntrophales bacterium]
MDQKKKTIKGEINAVDFFCGIGGFSIAVRGTNVRIVAAIDQSHVALDVYRLNFPNHVIYQWNLETVKAEKIAKLGASMWWLSPPCQPYTVRGRGRDVNDPRARSLLRILEIVDQMEPALRPVYFALENVEGFASSRMHEVLLDVFNRRGYRYCEYLLCPTHLGIPMRRPRYYFVASQKELNSLNLEHYTNKKPLINFINGSPSSYEDSLILGKDIIERFGKGFHVVSPLDPDAYVTCFTGGYGKSLMHSGSYLKCPHGIRRFSPDEIARLMGFPPDFRFPEGMTTRVKWRLLGNSLSIDAVRKVLETFPAIQWDEVY